MKRKSKNINIIIYSLNWIDIILNEQICVTYECSIDVNHLKEILVGINKDSEYGIKLQKKISYCK